MKRFFILFLLTIPLSTQAAEKAIAQTIHLYSGWNLVSLNIIHTREYFQPLVIQQVIPQDAEWFKSRKGKLYHCYDMKDFYPSRILGNREWRWEQAYYIHLDRSYTWNMEGFPIPSDVGWFEIRPSHAWDPNRQIPGQPMHGWFFLGYPMQDPCPIASRSKSGRPESGDPKLYDYLSPLHWLIWKNDATEDYPPYDLKIVKTDDGKIYIPTPDDPKLAVNRIGILEPGRGYFLGFYSDPEQEYRFDGWSKMDPETFARLPQIAPADQPETVHFKPKEYTHWSYPVLIDIIDVELWKPEPGDEIAAFDRGLCVGAAVFDGDYPIIITTWEKDIASSFMEWDGYIRGDPITLIGYDRSENRELRFMSPLITQSEDPIAPRHSGFGMGFYAVRSLIYGLRWVRPLPSDCQVRWSPSPAGGSNETFSLSLPERSRITIDLLDIRGELIWTIDGKVKTAGWHKILFNTSRLSSGVYIYRVTAEGLERGGKYQDVGKMLLLK
jgi:hypothetical protein